MLQVIFGVAVLLGSMFLSACAAPRQTPATASSSAEDHEGQAAAHGFVEGLREVAAVELGAGEKLHILATTNIVFDVVSNIGQDEIELIRLLPIGADPHSYEPTPQDLRSVSDAHAVFANGLGLEEFLVEMLQSAGGDVPLISASSGVTARAFHSGRFHNQQPGAEEAVKEDESVRHKVDSLAGEKDEHHHLNSADPHVWMDPNNVIIWTRNIERILSDLDPANAEAYAANAQAYRAQLNELDAWVREQLSQIPDANRELVTDHSSLGYFADAYGFRQVGAVIESFSTVAEPSAQELAALEDAIQQYDVPAIFVGITVNPKLAEQIARDTGIKILSIYTGSLGQPGSEADTYIGFIQSNVKTIVAGLQ